MSTQVQFRRGNTAQTSTFTGATAEITVDTDKKTIVVHDGSTAGGFALARENASNTAGSYANSAYATANSAASYANAAFAVANSDTSTANTGAAYANSAFAAANSASLYANAGFAVANSGSSYANSAFIVANNSLGIDATQNTNITNAGTYANSAFSAANTADAKAVTAGLYANSGFTQANSNYTSAVTKLDVTNSGASAYLIDQYSGNNPSIYVSGGETIAFNLNVSGHPFVIRESSGGANTSTGLTHVSTTGVVSTGASAQGNVTGVLYWKVPFNLVGNTYVYQCTIHGGMVGNIVIQQPASFVAANTTLAFNAANSAASYANSAFLVANTPTHVANSAASYANSAFATANTPSHVANSAASYANGAFASANTKLSSSGGSITGDVSITGNLTVTGNTTYTNTRTVLIADNIITVNAAIDQSAQPTVNAGIEVDRGAQPNSSFLWIETSGKWAANNGNTEIFLASEATLTSAFIAANTPSHVANSAASYANSAFAAANTATASGSYANSAFASANNEAGVNLTQNTNITSAGTYANSGFAKANSAFDHANVVFAFANTISGGAAIDNTARSLANSASLYANSAFAAANTDVTNINITTGTYGNSGYYPVITVSANGRINTVSTQVVTDPSAIAFAIALG